MAQLAVKTPKEVRIMRATLVRVFTCRGAMIKTGIMAHVRSVSASRPGDRASMTKNVKEEESGSRHTKANIASKIGDVR